MIQRIQRYRETVIRILRHKDTHRKALAFAARWHQPWLAARILSTMPTPLPLPSNTRKSSQRGRVLVLNSGKDEFFRDIEEIFRHDEAFELIAWPHYALPAMAETLLDQSLKHDTYVTKDPQIERSKARYRDFLRRMWRHHQKISRIDAVISANFGYCFQRELAFALEACGTPFLVVQKENLNAATEERRRVWESIYRHGRGPFGGRKIFVYNEMERDLELSSGIAGPNTVEITGMPRLDRLHRWRRQNAGTSGDSGTTKILFFSFARSDKIPFESGVGKNWGEFCAETHRAMIDFARENPQVEVVAKTKGITRQDEELLQLLGADDAPCPGNLHVVSGGDAFSLIAESQVVVGFNTSGLLEALALGKPVIVPNFGEALDPVLRKFVIDLGEAVEYANSPRQLKDMISQHAGRRLVTSERLGPHVEKILKYWVGNDDGEAGRRAYAAILREVTRKPAPAQ